VGLSTLRSWYKGRSLTTQVVFGTTILFIMLLLGYAIIDWSVYNRNAAERAERTSARTEGLLKIGIQNLLDHNDRIQLRSIMNLMIHNPMVSGVKFSLNTHAREPFIIEAGTFDSIEPSSVLRALSLFPGVDEKVIMTSTIRGSLGKREQWVADVQINFDVNELYEMHVSLAIRILAVFILMLVTIACLAVIFHRNIHKPILGILKSMQALKLNEDGPYRELQPVGQVEFDGLISGFNLYQSSLRLAHETQQKQITHLDNLVSEKTAHLQAALEKSYASEKTQQQIFQMMSLDLKQIIVACQFQVETLRRHANFQYDQETVSQIARLGNEMSNTYEKIEQILAFSATRAHSSIVVIEKVDLYREVESIIDKLSHQANLNGFCIDLIFDPTLPSGIEVSKDGLCQTITAMLSAAFKITVSGCVTIELSKGENIVDSGFYLHLDVKTSATPLSQEALTTLRNAASHGVVSDKGLGPTGISLGIALSRLREMAAFFEIESTTAGSHASIKMPVLNCQTAVSMDQQVVKRATRGKKIVFIVPSTSKSFCQGIVGRLTYLGQLALSAANADDVSRIVAEYPGHKTVLVGQRLSSLVMRENFAPLTELRKLGLSCILSLEFKSVVADDLQLPIHGTPDVVQDATVQMRTLISRAVNYCYPPGDHVHGIFIQQSPIFEAGTLKNTKIMLIDDSTAVLDGMSEYLRTYGAEVTTARSPLKGIRLAKTTRFDAICTDISMPQMSGIEVGFQIRQTTLNAKTPIVAMTAAILSEQEVSDISVLNMTVLNKNGIMDAFTATLSALIRKARSEDDSATAGRLRLVDGSRH
jgi:two-component system, NarL family, sensor histidine kinase BarA